MRLSKGYQLLILVALWFVFDAQGCTKVIAYGKNYDTDPKKGYFQSDKTSVLEAARKTLENMGFQLANVESERGHITTGWRPVQSDSHYFNLFGRQDFGAVDGTYYQLHVDLFEEGAKIKVLLSTKVKTMVGKVHSSGHLERKILTAMEHLLRSPQIEMTNVGVERK